MIPDGIYDNTATNRREAYCDGKLSAFITSAILMQQAIKLEDLPIGVPGRKPWGFYPQLGFLSPSTDRKGE